MGVQLGLDLSRLKDIEQTTGDSQRHRLEMVELWLQSTPGASWEDLVEALRGIDELVQAERINSKYIKRQRGMIRGDLQYQMQMQRDWYFFIYNWYQAYCVIVTRSQYNLVHYEYYQSRIPHKAMLLLINTNSVIQLSSL